MSGALQQFVGAVVTSVRRNSDAVCFSVKMPEGSWHTYRDLEIYLIEGCDGSLFVRIDGMYVPEDEL